MLFTVITTAVIGYALPWEQTPFWRATEITNLLLAIPYISTNLVEWIRGASQETKQPSHSSLPSTSFSHYYWRICYSPFTIPPQNRIQHPTGISSDIDKIPFHPCYTIKDLLGGLFLVLVLMILVLFSPNLLETQVTTLQQTLLIHLPISSQNDTSYLHMQSCDQSLTN